ncbi:MAG: (d)CMP kinase [Candidatus Eisenbacteria bacterium]|nr:(d)CMP kinase [Candidatus Eisenbacteria bacterium]
MPPTVIAIDGPAGTGKTTSAAGVARRLGFLYVDSGAVYRALALAVHEAGGESAPPETIASVVAAAQVGAAAGEDGFRVSLAGRDVTGRLRSPEVTHLASVLATRADVRRRVVEILHRLAEQTPVVVEGRDIGTVVFPHAALKIFLTAERRERARRRRRDLERMGKPAGVAEVERDLAQRDDRDAGRRLAPLAQAPDAVVVDTTDLTVEEQIDAIVDAYERKVGGDDA